TDCAFKYYKDTEPLIDCESGQSGWEMPYIDNCDDAAVTGYGVELDWLRQLWDVHTHGSSQPSFTAMANWIASADTWGDSDVFEELDDEASSIGGALWTNWSNAYGANGIDTN